MCRTRNAVYALRRTGGSNPSLSAKKKGRFVCLSLLKQANRSFFFEQGASGSLLGLRRNPSLKIVLGHQLYAMISNPMQIVLYQAVRSRRFTGTVLYGRHFVFTTELELTYRPEQRR